MLQVMPHRSNIVPDRNNCKNFLYRKLGNCHRFGLTPDWLLQLASAEHACASFAFGHRRFKRDQATRKAGVKLPTAEPAANRRERQ
jgi:hypothetical protein